MEKKRGGLPVALQVPHAQAAIGALPWKITLCFLGLLFVILVWYPVSRISAQYPFFSNEGFNTSFAAMVANGDKMYGTPPLWFHANYPPVSFHLISWLSAATHDLNVTGRWLALLSYLSIGALIALIVRRLSLSWQFAAYAAFCWLIWMAAFDVGRVAMNDPHLLGLAFSLAGLYCFVREPESVRWLSISAAACALGIFTKQSLIAFPAAIAIQLFFTSRKHLAIWLGAAAGTCLALLLLTYALDGRYFFDHLLLPRAYYPAALWESLGAYLYFTEVAFIVAVVWILRTAQPPSRRFLIWGFLVAHALGAFYCGGAGVGVNHMFDALILTAIIAGLSLPSLTKLAEDTPHPQLALTFLLVVPFFLTSLVVLTRRLPADLGHAPNEIAQNEAEFAGVANFLRARPGPALCETLMLCNAAGKPLTYDPFVVDQLIRTGTITQDKLVQLITSRQYPVIEIDWTANEPMTPAPRLRFPGPAMRALYATYQLSLRTQKYAVFTPRP